MNVNWDELEVALGAALREGVAGVIEGAEADVRHWGEAITRDLVAVLQSGDTSLRRELVAQARAIAEMQRVRAVNAQWGVFERVVDMLVSTAMRVVTPAVLP